MDDKELRAFRLVANSAHINFLNDSYELDAEQVVELLKTHPEARFVRDNITFEELKDLLDRYPELHDSRVEFGVGSTLNFPVQQENAGLVYKMHNCGPRGTQEGVNSANEAIAHWFKAGR